MLMGTLRIVIARAVRYLLFQGWYLDMTDDVRKTPQMQIGCDSPRYCCDECQGPSLKGSALIPQGNKENMANGEWRIELDDASSVYI